MLNDLGEDCWFVHLPGAWAHLTIEELLAEIELEQKELSWYGKTFNLPRLTAWYGDKGYNYSGILNEAKPMPKLLAEIQNNLQAMVFGDQTLEFNSVLCNYYRDGKDSVSWHSDDEASHKKNTIGSVSFGATRKFVIRHIETKVKVEFELAHGDVFIMGGKFQQFWEHQVPKTSAKVGPRLNLTYRFID